MQSRLLINHPTSNAPLPQGIFWDAVTRRYLHSVKAQAVGIDDRKKPNILLYVREPTADIDINGEYPPVVSVVYEDSEQREVLPFTGQYANNGQGVYNIDGGTMTPSYTNAEIGPGLRSRDDDYVSNEHTVYQMKTDGGANYKLALARKTLEYSAIADLNRSGTFRSVEYKGRSRIGNPSEVGRAPVVDPREVARRLAEEEVVAGERETVANAILGNGRIDGLTARSKAKKDEVSEETERSPLRDTWLVQSVASGYQKISEIAWTLNRLLSRLIGIVAAVAVGAIAGALIGIVAACSLDEGVGFFKQVALIIGRLPTVVPYAIFRGISMGWALGATGGVFFGRSGGLAEIVTRLEREFLRPSDGTEPPIPVDIRLLPAMLAAMIEWTAKFLCKAVIILLAMVVTMASLAVAGAFIGLFHGIAETWETSGAAWKNGDDIHYGTMARWVATSPVFIVRLALNVAASILTSVLTGLELGIHLSGVWIDDRDRVRREDLLTNGDAIPNGNNYAPRYQADKIAETFKDNESTAAHDIESAIQYLMNAPEERHSDSDNRSYKYDATQPYAERNRDRKPGPDYSIRSGATFSKNNEKAGYISSRLFAVGSAAIEKRN